MRKWLLVLMVVIVGCSSSKNNDVDLVDLDTEDNKKVEKQQVKEEKREKVEPIKKETSKTAKQPKTAKPKKEKKDDNLLYGVSVKGGQPDGSLSSSLEVVRDGWGKIQEFRVIVLNQTKQPITTNYFSDKFHLLDTDGNTHELKVPTSDYMLRPKNGRVINPSDFGMLRVLPTRVVKNLKDSDIKGMSCEVCIPSFKILLVNPKDVKKSKPKPPKKKPVSKSELKKYLKADVKTIAEESTESRTIALRQPIVIGQIKFIPVKLHLKLVKFTEKKAFSGTKEMITKEKVLVLYCIIQNISEGQVFQPFTKETLKSCILADNFDNQMSSIAEGVLETSEYNFKDRKLDELKPGKFMVTTVMSEKPKVDNAKDFIWKICMRTNNKSGFNYFSPKDDQVVYLKFTKNQIKEK